MSTPLVPNFIAGEWIRPAGLATTPVFNPSTGDVIAECPVGGTVELPGLRRWYPAQRGR